MNYGAIKENDIANGIGIRVSLFVSGCTHHCKNCFNPETWDFDYGTPYTAETEEYIINLLSSGYINGLSLLGGEPFEPQNQKELVRLLKRVKKTYPQKDVWCYTGYVLDKDIINGRAHCDVTDEMLSYIDVLVDGPFIDDLKKITLKFRGSENQRVIDVKKTLESGSVVLKME